MFVFWQYKVVSDYVPLENDQHGLSLKKNQTVEVMEQLETGRWFIRATTMTGQIEHGWVPSHILEQLPPDSEDTQDRTDDNNVRRRHTSAADSQQVGTAVEAFCQNRFYYYELIRDHGFIFCR